MFMNVVVGFLVKSGEERRKFKFDSCRYRAKALIQDMDYLI